MDVPITCNYIKIYNEESGDNVDKMPGLATSRLSMHLVDGTLEKYNKLLKTIFGDKSYFTYIVADKLATPALTFFAIGLESMNHSTTIPARSIEEPGVIRECFLLGINILLENALGGW